MSEATVIKDKIKPKYWEAIEKTSNELNQPIEDIILYLVNMEMQRLEQLGIIEKNLGIL